MKEPHHSHGHTPREVPAFPTEVTFKAVYKNHTFLEETIRSVLAENGLAAHVGSRFSRNAKFVSFTVTAEFADESHLNTVCAALASLPGFSTMF